MYRYNVNGGVKVVDGDTVDLMIDLGLRIYSLQRIRLSGVNTPELRASDPALREKAQQAKEFVETWFEKAKADGMTIIVTTFKDKTEKYGRYLGQIAAVNWKVRADTNTTVGTRVLNQDLVNAALAEEYAG